VKLVGQSISKGIVFGKPFIIKPELQIESYKISHDQIETEIKRFKQAILKTKEDLLKTKAKAIKELDEKSADIFQAHLLLLEDPLLVNEVIEKIKEEEKNIESVINSVVSNFVSMFENVEDKYKKGYASDIKDVGIRLLTHLKGQKHPIENVPQLKKKVIIIAEELFPSDLVHLNKKSILGICTVHGGLNSHTAILARSLKIPMVSGIENLLALVKLDDKLILDGTHGELIINPSKSELKKYKERFEKEKEYYVGLLKYKDVPLQTKDKVEIELAANIEDLSELSIMKEYNIKNIGLFRTEFLYMQNYSFPSYEEQLEIYTRLSEEIEGYVVIRTYDLGGDKEFKHKENYEEKNPFLGFRSLRICFAFEKEFRAQLRAILAASARKKNIKILLPLVTSVEEVKKAKRILNEEKAILRKKKIPFDDNIEVGSLIETPASALISDDLAKVSDFFSVGTNDLIQFCLAVDRVNENIADFFDPLHPAVLRLLSIIVKNAEKSSIKVGLCGEMARQPMCAIILAGLGFKMLSMIPSASIYVKNIFSNLTLKQMKNLTKRCLNKDSANDIRKEIVKYLQKIYKKAK